MTLMLLLCLDWAVAYESAPVLSDPESLATYRNIIARHVALEKYWLSLSGTLKISEKASNDPKPLETKIFLKVQNECYHKVALIEYEDLAHWVPHLDLWIHNDQYFAELYRAKAYPADPFEVVKWQLRTVNQPSHRDDFQNFYLCRTHREAVLSSGFNYWRWSYMLAASAKHLRSIKKIDYKVGSCYLLEFASSASGLPIKNNLVDWTQTLVGSAQEGYLVYDTRVGVITAMNVHVVTDEGYHYLIAEAANYRQQDSLVCPVHREATRQLISAEGKVPRVPQINHFTCDYDLSVVTHPAEIFTLTSMGFDEPEGLKTYNKFRSLSPEVIVQDFFLSAPEATSSNSSNWSVVLLSTGALVIVGIGGVGYYMLRRRKNVTVKGQKFTWAVE